MNANSRSQGKRVFFEAAMAAEKMEVLMKRRQIGKSPEHPAGATRHEVRARIVYVASACFALLSTPACVQGEEGTSTDVENVGTTAERTVIGESASPQDVVVFWQDSSETLSATALTASLRNSTADPIVVQLEILMSEPSGKMVTRSFGERTLQGHETVPVTIPLGDLPVQSVGAASTVTLVASYETHRPELGGSGQFETTLQKLQAHATPRYVTFASDFAQATIRSSAAQARLNLSTSASELRQQLAVGARFTSLRAARPTAVRIHPAATSEAAGVDEGTASEVPSGVMSFVDLPEGALPVTATSTAPQEN
jgi:hypothetical protein